MRPERRSPSSERGTAAVEFALVLPLVLIVALGLLQVGLIVRDRLLVDEAARAGARAASLQPDLDAVRSAALAAAPVLDATRVTVQTTREGGRGDPVQVTVRYSDPLRVPLVAWLVGDEVVLDASVTARQEFA
jgi:Flp pilus assembly protein TadG